MAWSRHTSVMVSLALLASIVGNYAVHRHFEARAQQLAATPRNDGSTNSGLLALPMPRDEGPSLVPRFLDDLERHRPAEHILPALQIRETEESEPDPAKSSRPEPVPAPHDAVPLTPDNAKAHGLREPPADALDASAVRRVIEDELAGSSREERDIWFEELKSLPAGVVRDLLQVRKQLRALPRALHKADPVETLPPVTVPPRTAEIAAEPASQTRRQPLLDWTPTLSALEQATSLARHNLANATTPGFKRIRWMLVDTYGSAWNGDASTDDLQNEQPHSERLNPAQTVGCRLATPLLDLQSGKQLQTGRPLDLAIDGDGFFAVVVDEKPLFTRCGALVLDAQRRLCLAAIDGSAVLQPAVKIPDDAKEIQISAQGEVIVLRGGNADSQSVGRLHLAQFASPTKLRPVGSTLLAATAASGAADLGEPETLGRGAIQQGCLEQSNVDVETELADIERLQTLLKSLPVPARPITASGSTATSR